MQKQFLITVDTSQNPAVQAFDLSAAPLTVPNGAVPVSDGDDSLEVVSAVESAITNALVSTMRGAGI